MSKFETSNPEAIRRVLRLRAANALVVALGLILFAGLFVTPTTVLRQETDRSGTPMWKSDGSPLLESDFVGNLFTQWRFSLCMGAAALLFVRGAWLLFKSLPSIHRVSPERAQRSSRPNG